MSEEKALTIRQRPRITADVWNVIESMAPVAVASRMFGVKLEQAAIVMATGYELGLPLTAAFDVIYVSSDGRRVLRPKGALALVRASGLLERFEWKSDDKQATVTMKRKGDESATSMTLTIADAQKAGWKSTAWKTTPQNMLRWRLIGWMCDLLFTDVLLGLAIADDSYLPIEITPDGNVIDVQAQVLPTRTPPEPETAPEETTPAPSVLETPVETPQETPPPAAVDVHTLADLVAKYGIPAIMAANENTPPGSDEDVARVWAKLEAQDG